MSSSHDWGHLCEQGSHCSHSCSTHRGVKRTAWRMTTVWGRRSLPRLMASADGWTRHM